MMPCTVKLLSYEGAGASLDDVDLVLPAYVRGHLVSTHFAATPPPLFVSARLTGGGRVGLLVHPDGWLPLLSTGVSQDDVEFAEDGYLDEETLRFAADRPADRGVDGI